MSDSLLEDRNCEFYNISEDAIYAYINHMLDNISDEIGYVPFTELLCNVIEKSRD
jgi:hypothetical protein